MADTSDVVIIGGGAAGCATAYYLAKRGIKSTVIERDGIASKASGFSAGLLNPLQGERVPGPLAPLALKSFRMHQEIWPELLESGVDFEPQIISGVTVAYDDSAIAEMEETHKLFSEADDDFHATWLDADQIQEMEPRLSPGAVRGIDAYGNATLSSYRYVLALAQTIEKMGAIIRSSNAVGIKTDGSRITSVILETGEIECDSVVFAVGPWSNQAESWLNIKIPVEPLKGEMLRMAPPNNIPLERDYLGFGVTLNHREDDQVWIGSTQLSRGFDENPSAEARDILMGGALKLMPSLADCELVLHTACLRPVTPDWLPIVGLAPGWDNAYLATGAGKKGILLSPGMGEAVAGMVAGGSLAPDMERFKIDRFMD
ncbi:MAG: FAD-dependent oxidoreductase [SAR202 cluster bacterium]|mgnify:CR=1 FL=1|jgi:glycine oxidase|nr:FAD-dependent oxidoreductase [SAR202 cluster bacterium]MDP6514363.1 FAD-dependent oxidoreductase [SAR202 cluster bacterium]MDP6713176.1 FAD-dependent oxidoreductase [SAR202 cluster bacterium]